MPDIRTLLPSEYLSDRDLDPGHVYECTIKSIEADKAMKHDHTSGKAKRDPKAGPAVVLVFHEFPSPLTLRRGRAERIASVLGSRNTDNWVGRRIRLRKSSFPSLFNGRDWLEFLAVEPPDRIVPFDVPDVDLSGETDHTPGPWIYEPPSASNPSRSVVSALSGQVTIYDAPRTTETTANARLIAAAPNLLAACRRILPLLRHGRNTLVVPAQGTPPDPSVTDLINTYESAIAMCTLVLFDAGAEA